MIKKRIIDSTKFVFKCDCASGNEFNNYPTFIYQRGFTDWTNIVENEKKIVFIPGDAYEGEWHDT